MDNNFLTYLDQSRIQYITDNNILNKSGFICYFPLRSLTITTRENYQIAKKRKSRILINHGEVFVDLTDFDMIDIILKWDTASIVQLLNGLRKCYSGEWNEFQFQIDDVIYTGKGIDYQNFNLTEEIYLDADFSITKADFLFILNMILFKDISGQEYEKNPMILLLVERTLIKYISLIIYYHFHDPQLISYLEKIKYVIPDRKKLTDKDTIRSYKKYDRQFDKEEFNKINFEKFSFL